MGINWSVTDQDFEIIEKIAERAYMMARSQGVEYDMTSLAMQVIACHLNGCPLKLQALLDADNFNFSHDVFGIANHIDRKTGKLTRCFLPRFADLRNETQAA